MKLLTAPTISKFPLPLQHRRHSPTAIRFQPFLRRTTYFPSLRNETGHRNSSLRSTTSEEISTGTNAYIKDESKSTFENRDDYESELNKELQEGSLFDNPLKLFKFLEDLNVKNVRSFYLIFYGLGSVAMMSIISAESSKMLGEVSTVMLILSGYLSNLMTVLFYGGHNQCKKIIIPYMLPVRQTDGLDLSFSLTLDYEQTYSTLAFGSGGAVAFWLVAAIIDAIDSIPVLPKALELVGLGYTLWFSSRYLILKKNRDELFARAEQLKQQVLGSKDDSN